MAPEETENLGFTLPEATRGGDANDVVEAIDAVNQILGDVDRASGDYVGRGAPAPVTLTSGDGIITLPDLLSGATPVSLVEFDGGVIGPESDFARVDEDGTVTIKAGGAFSLNVVAGISTDATEGEIMIAWLRSDQPYNPIGMGLDYCGVNSVMGAAFGMDGAFFFSAGPMFIPKDTTLTPQFVTNANEPLEVHFSSVAIEHL